MKLIPSIFACGLLAAAIQAQATTVVVVVGDSIMHVVADGVAADHALSIVSRERDVIFKNISAPSASLGATGVAGFNNDGITETIDRIGGTYNAYSLLIIQAGTNDFGLGVPVNDTKSSLRRILSGVRANGKVALMLEPIWRASELIPNNLGLTLNDYRYAMATVCNWEYPDVCRFANKENTIMGTAGGATYYSYAETQAHAQIHPNAAGNYWVAKWIEAEAAKFGLF